MGLRLEVDDVLHFGISLSLLLRWSTSIFPYSGASKSPMYGDYEAQRHWMEITVNLPMKEWYKNSTKNDLLYWGLDYPPLTAYHSLICGQIARWFNENWVALFTSRGYESYQHKLFMRSTVIFSDLFIFIPAVIIYWTKINKPCRLRDKAVAATLTLLYPGFILVDHGHFQYNCVSLGLCLWAILLLMQNYDVLGSVAFTLAINYKQMELYHSFPFFFYLLGTCKQQTVFDGIKKFIKLSLAVILTTAICWSPFLTDINTTVQVFSRLFPLDRGLYEDKVANFWYCLSIIIKFKQIFSTSILALTSAIMTLIFVLPSSLHLFQHPSITVFKFALVNSSLVFFLLSYQVHEKSILLVALPAILLIDDFPLEISWFLTVSTFSMFPLMVKDGLIIPYFSLSILFLVGVFRGRELDSAWKHSIKKRKAILFSVSILGCIALGVATLTVKPMHKYPHLHSVLNALYSFVHFVCFAIYFHYLQWKQLYPEITKLKAK